MNHFLSVVVSVLAISLYSHGQAAQDEASNLLRKVRGKPRDTVESLTKQLIDRQEGHSRSLVATGGSSVADEVNRFLTAKPIDDPMFVSVNTLRRLDRFLTTDPTDYLVDEYEVDLSKSDTQLDNKKDNATRMSTGYDSDEERDVVEVSESKFNILQKTLEGHPNETPEGYKKIAHGLSTEGRAVVTARALSNLLSTKPESELTVRALVRFLGSHSSDVNAGSDSVASVHRQLDRFLEDNTIDEVTERLAASPHRSLREKDFEARDEYRRLYRFLADKDGRQKVKDVLKKVTEKIYKRHLEKSEANIVGYNPKGFKDMMKVHNAQFAKTFNDRKPSRAEVAAFSKKFSNENANKVAKAYPIDLK